MKIYNEKLKRTFNVSPRSDCVHCQGKGFHYKKKFKKDVCVCVRIKIQEILNKEK